MKKIIYIVDDSIVNLTIVEKGLREFYEVIQLPSAKRMFEMLDAIRPALILLDVVMPEMDGFEALEKLKQDPRYADIPVMFLTGRSDVDVEIKGFEMGVVDFVSKPFSIPVLYNRVSTHLDIDGLLKQRTKALEKMHRSQLLVLANVIESRDAALEGRINNTSMYVDALVAGMFKYDVYTAELQEWDLENVGVCAALHDIGKISIPEAILNKPAKLMFHEFDIIKTHTTKGSDIINSVINITEQDKYLADAYLFAEFHHENWDGSGYPHGLKWTNIPLQGRVMAIVDVYDALVSERPYKDVMPHELAVKTIMNDSGKKFDPKIANVFFTIESTFKEILEQSK